MLIWEALQKAEKNTIQCKNPIMWTLPVFHSVPPTSSSLCSGHTSHCPPACYGLASLAVFGSHNTPPKLHLLRPPWIPSAKCLGHGWASFYSILRSDAQKGSDDPFCTLSLGLSASSLCLLLPTSWLRSSQPLPGAPLSLPPASPSGWVLPLGGTHQVSGVSFHLSAHGSQILPLG